MAKTILIALTSLLLVSWDKPLVPLRPQDPNTLSGTLEKAIVANGTVTMDVDLNHLNGGRSSSQVNKLRFEVAPNSFFTILVFNNDLRGIEPGSMRLIPQSLAHLPAALNASYHQLIVERTLWGEPYELVVRDEKTGFIFFNIEGHQYDYAANEHLLGINKGRLLLSKEFAAILERPADAGSTVGEIAITANMRAIEITQVVNGEARSSVMPSVEGVTSSLVSGPDVIVGDLSGLAQFGSSGTMVGLAVGTDSCNAGVVPLNWFALPNNDHPVIPQNLYRKSGGATNDQRFEQVGQSSVKHAFTALQQNICGFGCSPTASTTLGAGCSDPYSASLNSGGSGNNLGSRAWINPFTGAYPRGDSATPPNSHSGHAHTGTSHRILVAMNDLNTTLNPGATYFAEAQYVTPHEYAWCQTHPGECNMANNASYRQYSVSGTTSFSFSPVGATVRTKPAIVAWNGATINQIEPDPGNDGIGFVAYKVTNTSPGVWHYEYAVYNQNLDRAIQSFRVPLGAGVVVENIGFHAPPQHPAWANDGTVGSAGYSSTPWTPTQFSDSLTWSSETFAQNPNANAIRWGTLYNFRFDSESPPQTTNATVGFFKTGAPILVQIQAPSQGITQPSISINDMAVPEGNAGTTSATFTVTLSSSSTDTVTVQYATANGTATAGSDYVTASGTVTFTPGDVSEPVSITVNGDTTFEPNETFNVNLSGTANATIADNQGVGTINNDDGQPTISINDVSVTEGNAATTSAGFTVSLSNASSQTITVNYATTDGTATAGTDYETTSGALIFTPGQTSQPLSVTVNGDLLNEAAVTFNVNLSGAANATIADNQGVGTIVDDDAPILATEQNSQRAIALDTVLFVRDPFAVTNLNYFGMDKRTRVSLFTENLILTPGLVVTAQAVDSQQRTFALPVEVVDSLPTFLGFAQIVVKLPDGIVNVGDLQVTITVRGRTSNSVLVGVTP